MIFRRTIFAGLLSLYLLPLTAQPSTKVDSLEALLKNHPQDTGYVNILNQLSVEVSDKNAAKAIDYAQTALAVANQLNYKKGIGAALNNLGWAHYRKSDFSKGFDYSLQGLHLNDSLKNLPQLALSYRNIGAIYNSQARFKESMEYFLKELSLHQSLNNKSGIGRALNNLAFSAYRGKFMDTAQRYAEMALAYNKNLNDHYLQAFAMRTMGDIFLSKGDADKAILVLNQAINEARLARSNFLIETALYRLGMSYQAKKQWRKSITYLLEGLTVAKEMGAKGELALMYKLLAQSYSALGDYKNAFEMQVENGKINDSLFETKNRERLAFAQTQFETEKKQAEISLLKKEDQRQKEKIRSQQELTVLLLVVLGLFIALLVVYYRRNIFKRNANQLLEQQKLELETASNQKDKIFSILSHDLRSPVASLSSILPLLGSGGLSGEEIGMLTNKLSVQVNSLNNILDDLLLWSKNQMHGVSDVNAVDFNLYDLVVLNYDLLRDMADKKNINITNNVPSKLLVHADRQHINIVIRNLILNAIKFTKPGGSVSISAEEQAGKVVIKVADTGIGMTEDQISKLFNLSTHFTTFGTGNEKGTGLGLLLCKEFVDANHGAIHVNSKPDEGSIFSVELPTKKV